MMQTVAKKHKTGTSLCFQAFCLYHPCRHRRPAIRSPCLLYGYGAYGVTISADFETDIFSLVNRDFIYAIAHIRGGEDKGFAWYENGKHRYKAIRSQISLRSSAIW